MTVDGGCVRTWLPADRRALVAIDLGAESCRVSLLRWVTGAPALELVSRFSNHAVEGSEGLRWDLEAIVAGLHAGLIRCAEIATEGIRSVAVDGWAVDYVRLNEVGEPAAQPFCYRDERTVTAEAWLHERISAVRMRELTGIQLLRLNTVYQMAADDAGVRRLPWLNLPEYVLYRLGGRRVSERSNASHTQMLGLDGEWAAEILSHLQMTAADMPALVDPGTDIGQLGGELAALPAFSNTRLIAPACHDTASAIAAIPDGKDDWAYISSGTWSLVGTLLREPENGALAREENFTNLVGADRAICFHKNVNGMWLLRQCIEAWEAEGWSMELPVLVERAATVSPTDLLLDVDDPDLLLSGGMPERISAQLARPGLVALDVSAKNAAAVAALIFRSLARRYAEVLGKVTEITGKPLKRIYVMGGGSQNEFLNRLTAEATGLPVVRVGTECSTVGNFAVQLATLETPAGEARPAAYWAERLG